MANSSIWHIDRTLSGATILSQSGPRSNANEGKLHIPQSSSIPGASPSDSLVSYAGHLLGGSYPFERCSQCILLPGDWVCEFLDSQTKFLEGK